MHRNKLLRTIALAVPLTLAAASPAASQTFVERAAAVGLDHVFISGMDRIGNLAAMNDWGQVGVAVGDLNGDGLLDVVAAGHIGKNRIFRNDGGSFTDVTAFARINTEDFDNAVALGDYDADGDLDLWLGSVGRLEGHLPGNSRLYENDGSGRFDDVTALAGVEGAGHSIHGKWFDVDYDGDLDLLVSEFHGGHNLHYVNNGDGSFTERGAETGIDSFGSTHIMGIVDVDGDGYVDVLVGNDYRVDVLTSIDNNEDDVHLRNDGNGYFTDVSVGAGFDHGGPDGTGPGSGTMGMTFADVNYDGVLDLYKTEQDDQFLMISGQWPAGSPWTQAQDAYGVANATTPIPGQPGKSGPTVGWGCFFFDADRDRWEDLFKVNGHVGPNSARLQQNYMYRCDGPGAGFTFSDVTASWGLLDLYDDRGLAASDLDADGDVDLLVAPPGGSLRYFENQIPAAGNGYLHVTVDARTSAPGGGGTVVRWTDSLGHPHVRQIDSDSPSASQHEQMVYFGLGPETSVDLEVAFPSGLTRTLPGVLPDQHLTVVEPELIRLSAHTFRPAAPSATPVAAGGSTGASKAGPGGQPLRGGVASGATAAVGAPTSGRGSVAPAATGLTVTAFAHDAAGTPLDGDADVSIEVPGLIARGPVEHVGGNAFRRVFDTDARPGAYRVHVSFDAFDVRIRPTVSIVGPLSAETSTTIVTPEGVRADTSDPFEVVFVPRDANGLLIGPGHTATVEVLGFGGIPETPLVDAGDGSYRAELTAPVAVGFKYVTVRFDGQELFGVANLDAAFEPTELNTVVYREDPHFQIALHLHQFKFGVTPRDLFGLRVGPEASVQLVITPDPGSEPVSERTDLSPVFRDDGEIVFVVERDPGAAVASAEGDIEVIVDGITVATLPYRF